MRLRRVFTCSLLLVHFVNDGSTQHAGAGGDVLIVSCSVACERHRHAMTMPVAEDGPWAHSDIFHEPTDPEMVEYLGRKRESLQNQVCLLRGQTLPWWWYVGL